MYASLYPRKTGFLQLNNALYFGEYDWRRLPDGSGVIMWTGGEMYVGGFAQGKMQGNGILLMSNGGCGCGSFKNGLLDGQGIIVLPNGDMIIAWFSEGKREGLSLHYLHSKKSKHYKKYKRGFVEAVVKVEKGEIEERGSSA